MTNLSELFSMLHISHLLASHALIAPLLNSRTLMQNTISQAINYRMKQGLMHFSWPLLMIICVSITGYGYIHDQLLLFFNLAYLTLILSLFLLERYIPHETQWLKNDGQFWPDILHTLSSKGSVQLLFALLLLSGGVPLFTAGALWPESWPMVAQIILGLVIAEFGLYWAHRLAHEVPVIWRVHAIHHSVKRLWFVNTGRFHIFDALLSIIFGLSLLIIAGAPEAVVQWVSMITAFIGMLTHCNVNMRFSRLSIVFNTPELHRWHHSKDLREGNKNYGENLMLWDWLLGTYFRESHRRPPQDIGLKNGTMPSSFINQLLYPFYKKQFDQRAEAKSSHKPSSNNHEPINAPD